MKRFPSIGFSRPLWTWVWRALFVGGGVLVLVAGVYAARTYSTIQILRKSGNGMRQLFAAFQLYVNATPENYYPPRSADPEVFLPDMDAWAAQGTGLAEFEEGLKVFDGIGERPLCYLGYAFYDEASAQRLLDKLEKNPQALRGGGTRLEVDPYVSPDDPAFWDLAALRKGAGSRYLWSWYVFGGLGPSEGTVDSPIPILWQMPDNAGERVAVLHLSGSVNFCKYPGEFPMTPLFVNRVRGLMGLPQDLGFSMDTPILPVLREILEAGSGDPGRDVGTLGPFDAAPSVLLGDTAGYRIALGNGAVVLFSEATAPGNVDAVTLFEPSRGFYYGLPRHTAVRYMGTSRGYHWYGKLDYGVFSLLQESFALSGGDSLYEAAAIYWLDRWPNDRWLNPPGKAPGRPAEILRQPPKLEAYVHAYIVERMSQRDTNDLEIIHAAAVLCGADYEGYYRFTRTDSALAAEAGERLVAAAAHEPEAAATLLMPVILRQPGRGARRLAKPERIELLKRLPRESVLGVVGYLAEHLQDAHEAGLCRELLDGLE